MGVLCVYRQFDSALTDKIWNLSYMGAERRETFGLLARNLLSETINPNINP